jgi:sensor domain CHASE-containing protein
MRILKAVLTLVILVCQWSIAQNVEGKSLLIYTKNGKGYVHENIEASVTTLVQLCKELGVKTILRNNAMHLKPFVKVEKDLEGCIPQRDLNGNGLGFGI